MDVDNEVLVTLPLAIQLAKERLWSFQCGWNTTRSGGPCKITLNSWHSLRQVSRPSLRALGAVPCLNESAMSYDAAYVDDPLSRGRNCESHPLNLISKFLILVQECKLPGCNLIDKITRDATELRGHILTGHLNNLKLPCPIRGAARHFLLHPLS